MLQIKINKDEFETIKFEELSLTCFEPLIKNYKNRLAEQDYPNVHQIRESFYGELTRGQQALFMFYAYYNHVSKSLTEFYWWSAYFMAQPKSWSAIKNSFLQFEDESMYQFLGKFETKLKQYGHPETLEAFEITREGFEQDKLLYSDIKSLHHEFEKASPMTIHKLNTYIHKNLQSFLDIEE